MYIGWPLIFLVLLLIICTYFITMKDTFYKMKQHCKKKNNKLQDSKKQAEKGGDATIDKLNFSVDKVEDLAENKV